MDNIGSKIARGAAWMVVLRMLVKGLGFISTLVLARLLVPKDFGLIAMAMSVYFIIEVLGSFGFSAALVQKQDIDRSYYDTAWTLNVITGLFSAILLSALAIPTAIFYSEPRLSTILYVLAVYSLFVRFSNIAVVDFQKELQMHKVLWIQLPAKIAAVATQITIAVIFKTYWALIAGICAGGIVRVVTTYLIHPFRPRPDLSRLKDLFSFSSWVFLTGIFTLGNNRADDMVIGRFTGATALGLYSIAYELSNMASNELVQPINHTLFPGYAKVSSDLNSLRWYYLRTFSLMALVLLPIGAGLSVVAHDMIAVMLGSRWLDAAPLVQILALYGVLRALTAPGNSVFMAVGRPRINTILAGTQMVMLMILLLIIVPTYGAVGAAWTQLSVAAVMTAVCIYIVARHVSLTIKDFSLIIWRPIVATAAMTTAVSSLESALLLSPTLIRLLVEVCSGAATYALSIYVLWLISGRPDTGENYILARMKNFSTRLAKAQ